LCELLWEIPDDPRAALRWSLAKLRRLVDEPDRPRILSEGDTVRLDREGMLIDVLEAKRRAAEGLSQVDTAELEQLAWSFRGARYRSRGPWCKSPGTRHRHSRCSTGCCA
jgi:DNA-binding SARP family transcriptional activator